MEHSYKRFFEGVPEVNDNQEKFNLAVGIAIATTIISIFAVLFPFIPWMAI